jgi:hypothetical protein
LWRGTFIRRWIIIQLATDEFCHPVLVKNFVCDSCWREVFFSEQADIQSEAAWHAETRHGICIAAVRTTEDHWINLFVIASQAFWGSTFHGLYFDMPAELRRNSYLMPAPCGCSEWKTDFHDTFLSAQVDCSQKTLQG